MGTQPSVHFFDKLIGVGVFRPGVRKGDEVNGDSTLLKPNQKGGTVRAAPKGYNVQFYTSAKNYQFIRP